jgi:hypothetical protein
MDKLVSMLGSFQPGRKEIPCMDHLIEIHKEEKQSQLNSCPSVSMRRQKKQR